MCTKNMGYHVIVLYKYICFPFWPFSIFIPYTLQSATNIFPSTSNNPQNTPPTNAKNKVCYSVRHMEPETKEFHIWTSADTAEAEAQNLFFAGRTDEVPGPL